MNNEESRRCDNCMYCDLYTGYDSDDNELEYYLCDYNYKGFDYPNGICEYFAER